MNLKNIILVLTLVVQVRSRCDDYFMCLSGFVKDYLSVNVSENASDKFDTETVNVDDSNNKSVAVFDLSSIGRSLSQALSEVTALIKDEIKGVFSIDDQIDVHKDIENKTEIHVRTLSLNKKMENTTEENPVIGTETTISIPELIVNNLTKFNDELSALKVEIEKNLQEELEKFISQVLENDSVDWIGVTEASFDTEFTTTENSYLDFEKGIETTTQIIGNNVDDVNILVSDQSNKNDNQINDESNTNSDKVHTVTEIQIKDKENHSNLTKDIYDKSLNTLLTTMSSKIAENASTSTADMTANKAVVELMLAHNIKVTDSTVATNSSTTTVDKNNTSPVLSTTTILTTTSNSTRRNDVPTTSFTSSTTKLEVTTPSINRQETHTKAPIDYKLLENVRINEISSEDTSYYEIQDDNITDYPIIDYVDLYKDTTNEDLGYVPTVRPFNERSELENVIQEDELTSADNDYYTNDTSRPTSVFPWIAAIFVKNGTSSQFDYYCDGIILSKDVVLTAARCLQRLNETVDDDDFIVFLGKRSLQNTAEGESIHKVKQLTLHPNFTLQGDAAQNDLAILHLEHPAEYSERIQPACLLDGDYSDSVTTAWGEKLSLVRFVEKNITCEGSPVENTFCATYGSTVALCPSYGGVFAALQAGGWCAGGVRTADVTSRGLCFDRAIRYTDLTKHTAWLRQFIL